MSKKKPVQTGLMLKIDSEVTRCIRQHARAHMKTEVCGVLIGEQNGDTVEIQASIEASSAAQGGTHVTFTQDAWEEIYRVKDFTYPDHRIVGWYHSHPGFGVFLSEHDTFIHRNFFSSPKQVAWVYDPHTDEEGCFGWFNGEIERIECLSVVDHGGNGEERTPKERHSEMDDFDDAMGESSLPPPPMRMGDSQQKPKNRWTFVAMNVASYLSVAMLGFLISLFLFPPRYLALVADPLTGQNVGVAIDISTGDPLLTKDGRMEMIGPIHIEHFVQSSTQAPHQPSPLSPPPAQAPSSSPAPLAPAPSNPKPGGSK